MIIPGRQLQSVVAACVRLRQLRKPAEAVRAVRLNPYSLCGRLAGAADLSGQHAGFDEGEIQLSHRPLQHVHHLRDAGRSRGSTSSQIDLTRHEISKTIASIIAADRLPALELAALD